MEGPWFCTRGNAPWIISSPMGLGKHSCHASYHETTGGNLFRTLDLLFGRKICVLICRAWEDDKRNNGIPKVADRYRWRYWDNQGHVYQDAGIKWTTTQGEEFFSDSTSALPGEFRNKQLWMVEGGSLQREFWDIMWRFKFEGSSTCEEWDQCLLELAKQAGMPSDWPLKEAELDVLALGKGWTKVQTCCHQPAMEIYCKNDETNNYQRINFYLSTGTVATCLDHPTPTTTQLFRRGIDMAQAAALLDNPRQHTGRGYKRKRNDESSQPTTTNNNTRRCAACRGDMIQSDFSKTHWQKGKHAICRECVAAAQQQTSSSSRKWSRFAARWRRILILQPGDGLGC